jgi:hypothetical protein
LEEHVEGLEEEQAHTALLANARANRCTAAQGDPYPFLVATPQDIPTVPNPRSFILCNEVIALLIL